MTELPLLDHQRAARRPEHRPADQDRAGRPVAGDLSAATANAPLPVIAARSPADCFDVAQEAWRIATRFMTPVILLSDGYIANGSEPWLIPDVTKLPQIEVKHPGRRQNGDDVPAVRPRRAAGPAVGHCPARRA